VRFSEFARPLGLTFAILLLATAVWAQGGTANRNAGLPDEAGRFFDIKIPDGFKQEAVDEPGILRWKKDDGEIYLVVGELFAESAERFLSVLQKAAEKDSKLMQVKAMRVKGGRGLLFKDKPPEDPARLRSWRVLVVADKKVLSVDFTSPQKVFDSFVPAFEEAIKSLKVKSRS
jgi:hypothetical protein